MPPPKKVPQTDAIFAHLSQVHRQAGADATVVRLSLDSKAAVVLGPFARGGSSRTGIRAVDHDFKPLGKLTPFGIFWLGAKELSLYFTATKVSSDFMVDRLAEWWQRHGSGLRGVRRLLLDLDNGPENHGYRSQFLYRLVCLAQAEQLAIELAYYPPYHSKYNPIERCWSSLEKKWNGVLLTCWEVVRACALRMTWRRKHPVVERLERTYSAKVKVSKGEMKDVNARLERSATLPKYDITIKPRKPRGR